ncbi:MAG: DNA topoisomerase IV subunit A [Bacilli bacterium]|nr:DNA topoisomerase IV subunit A [Bacilli bacterium]
MKEVLNKIYDYSLEEIMGDRFGRYAKTIIQNRAIPDVRDGLKPVQRRILYSMYKDRNTFDKPYRKSAKSVGAIMGSYHPHGDSSIYDAMVRMSQWWKQNSTYVDMQGNNGSMDGDSAAAMRYTEARLSKISNELLKDIDKETVIWAPNYDDTTVEPTVLPAKYPNLLVNGATGISAGYATNIPPHNLGEVIDATIKRIDSPNCYLDTIIDIVKGPDFPTGGIVEGKDGIVDAYTTGRGRIILKSKYEFIKTKGKEQIIITEIPYDVNKSLLVKKMDEIRIDKKIDGIVDVRDESDRDGLTIAIDLKKDADTNLIINYLLKNTDLQVSYNFNVVAIVNRRPMTLGILAILDAYINHQKEVITKRTEFDLKHAKARVHIVEGLIKALSILDEVIKTIRASKNKADAKDNLVKQFGFSELQADAIVMLQLYKLTNTDVTELIEENKNLQLIIKGLEEILNDEEKLKFVMKEELRKIKKEYAIPRKTEIKDEITEIKIDPTQMIPKEDCIVVVTNDGYVKRVSPRSYKASEKETTMMKDNDYVIGLYNLNTLDTVLLFTNLGNYLYLPVADIPDLKWGELGKHISNIITTTAGENIIGSIPVTNFDDNQVVTIFSKNGMIKRTNLSEFKVQRYSKPISCMKLKKGDEVVNICTNNGEDIFISTKNGYGLRYKTEEVSVIGIKAAGVKSIDLKNDEVVNGHTFTNEDYLVVVTDKGTAKRVKLTDIKYLTRARKGNLIVRDVKTNPYYIVGTHIITGKKGLTLKTNDELLEIKVTELPIVDCYSTGTVVTKKKVYETFIVTELEEGKVQNDQEIIEEDEELEIIDLDSIDERILTIDDFLDNFDK